MTGKLDEDALKAALDSFNEVFSASDEPGHQPEHLDPGHAGRIRQQWRPLS